MVSASVCPSVLSLDSGVRLFIAFIFMGIVNLLGLEFTF